jgi:uncharacterized ferritin-like protein (DUF455 family)
MSGATFAPGPARDSRFDVRERWADLSNLPEGHPDREVEFFNRQMNEEINGLECAARNLADFPEAEWELRMAIARQCYDEARHVEMFRALVERGGRKVGWSPVMNFQYRIITNVADLEGRLAVQNRSFEAEGVDAIEPEIAATRARGDVHLSEQYEAQLADEICHVRFANRHLAKTASRDPASVMRIIRALNYASEAFLWVMGREAIDAVSYPVNAAGRIEAGFSAEETRHAAEVRAARMQRN